MLLSICLVCASKKSKFLKQEEASELLSSLGKKDNTRYKRNKIVSKFLLAGDKFKTARIYIRCLWKEYKNLSRYIYQNELDQACFQYGMVYGDFEDLTRTTASDKILHDKAFNVATNMMNINGVFLQWLIKLLIKGLLAAVLKMKLFPIKNQQKNHTNQLLGNLIKDQYNHLL